MSTILVIEDHLDSANFLITALRQAGHTVTHALNGRSALDGVVERAPDLIVLDLRLPDMDGTQFLKVLRSYLRWQHIPVIIVSAGTDLDIEHAAAHGVVRVFRKAHFAVDDLLHSVSEILATAPSPLSNRLDDPPPHARH